jgi:hypothetical protein
MPSGSHLAFINHYPLRGGSAIQHRLSCTCSGSNDVVKRNLWRLVDTPIEVGVWQIKDTPEMVHASSLKIGSKPGRR